MGNFSFAAAVGAGFRLIAREPIAFLVWAAVYLLIALAPQIGIFALVLPDWTTLMRDIAASAAQTPGGSAEMLNEQAKMMQLQPISWLSGIVAQTLLLGAVYRAVLFPQDRKFFYLRLGGRELWLGLVMLVVVVMVFMLAFVIALPTALIAGLLGVLARQAPVLEWAIAAVLVAAFGLYLWVFLRLSLATPMSFAQRGFRLYESWDMTRGLVWKMFGVIAVLFLVALAAEAILIAIGLGASGGLPDLVAARAWFRRPTLNLQALAPWIVGGGIVVSLLSTAGFALLGGAWAEIYREITAGQDEPLGQA